MNISPSFLLMNYSYCTGICFRVILIVTLILFSSADSWSQTGQDPPSPCNPGPTYDVDVDGDGYTDKDEEDNGSDPCSAASKPINDFDQSLIAGFLVSDLNDPDDDDDGILDLVDPFVWDASNGNDLVPPFLNDFNEQGVGIGGIGITGLMTNGVTDYHDQYNAEEVILGGTSGLLIVPSTTSGDAFVNNLQDNSFQFGVNVSTNTGPFIVKAKINGPFFNNNLPINWQSQGFYIGTGDQNNYLKLVLTANNGNGGFEVFQENDGSKATAPNDQMTYPVTGLLGASSIELYLRVDPVSGDVQPKYSINEGPINDLGSIFNLQGNLLQAVQGTYTINGKPSSLAIGIIATSFKNQPEFSGTWDYIELTADSPSTSILVDEISDQLNTEGDQPILAVVATGGSSNLNYSASGLPAGLLVEPTNGQIVGTIASGASNGGVAGDGVHQVSITVDDGGASLSTTIAFDWTVQSEGGATENCSWVQAASPDGVKYEAQAVAVNGKLYVFAGFTEGIDILDITEVYDPLLDQWATLTPMPIPVTHVGAVVIGNDVWFAGGFIGDSPGPATDVVQIYHTDTDSWSNGPSIPAPRGGVAMALVGSNIHIFGGLLPDRKTDTGEHYVLDIDNQGLGWQPLADMPDPRNHHGGVALNGKVYAVGGQFGHDSSGAVDINSLHVYDPVTNSWTRLANLPIARSHIEPGTFIHDNKIFIVGGRSDTYYLNDVSYYNPTTNQWHEFCSYPADLMAPGAKIIGDQLIVTNGALWKDEPQNTTYLAEISIGSLPPLVSAGFNSTVTFPTTSIALNGVGLDPDGGTIVNFLWTQIDGPSTAALSNYNSANLTASGLVEGGYIFRLTVTDDEGNTGYDEVLITVIGGNPPVVDAGEDLEITLPMNSVVVNASGSDPDGGQVSFLWDQQSGPADATLTNESTSSLSAGNLVSGIYVFRLTVVDDEGSVAYDEMEVTVNESTQQGVVSFTLINVITNQPVPGYDPIVNGSVINLTTIGTDQLNIRANTNPPLVGSVLLVLDGYNGGSGSQRMENVAPYALFGDSEGNFLAWSSAPQPGNNYILTGMAYTQSKGKGSLLGSLSISFSFTDQVTNLIPTASAGPDQNLTLPTNTISLSGTGNDPDGGAIEGYQWSLQSGPSPVTLTGSTTSSMTASGLIEGDYIFRLTVIDDEGDTGYDDIIVSVVAGQAPIVSAGTDQSVNLPVDNVVLNGSASDPDGGDISTYIWTLQDGPATVTLTNENTPNLTASGFLAGSYVFRLTVTDDEGETNFSEVLVTVNTQSPLVNAGDDVHVVLPIGSVNLSGSASDPDGGSIVSYLWTQQPGANVANMSGQTTPDLTINSLVEGTYQFILTVIDDENETAHDEVQVTVSPVIQQGVISYTLIDATTDQPIAGYDPIIEGQQIDLSALTTDQLNIRANTNPSIVGSVLFTLQGFNGGSDYTRTENGAPYALFGDTSGDYATWIPVAPVVGNHYSLTASAFAAKNGGGEAIGAHSISFSFISNSVTNNPPIITEPGNQHSVEGDNISLDIFVTDGDQGAQTLSFAASNLPPGLSINPVSGQITGLLTTGSSNSGIQEQDGLVIIEAESVSLANNWTQGIDGSIAYYEAAQDNFNNPVGGGILQYQINITNPGIYRFEWRSKINQGTSHTDSNDNWLKFPNNSNVVFFGYKGSVSSESQLDAALQSKTNIVFPKGSGLEGAGTTPNGAGSNGYFKVFMNTLNNWVWSAKTSDNDGHELFVKFINPGTYTMEVSNRSYGHAIDKMALYKIDTYGNDYSDNLLTGAPASTSGQSGASNNSPYQVEVTVTDDGIPALSASVNFIWVVDPEAPSTMALKIDSGNLERTSGDNNSHAIAEVYPNPVADILNVKIYSMVEDRLILNLYGTLGRDIYLGEHSVKSGRSLHTIDIRSLNLAPGSYYLKISSGIKGTIFNHKLLVK